MSENGWRVRADGGAIRGFNSSKCPASAWAVASLDGERWRWDVALPPSRRGYCDTRAEAQAAADEWLRGFALTLLGDGVQALRPRLRRVEDGLPPYDTDCLVRTESGWGIYTYWQWLGAHADGPGWGDGNGLTPYGDVTHWCPLDELTAQVEGGGETPEVEAVGSGVSLDDAAAEPVCGSALRVGDVVQYEDRERLRGLDAAPWAVAHSPVSGPVVRDDHGRWRDSMRSCLPPHEWGQSAFPATVLSLGAEACTEALESARGALNAVALLVEVAPADGYAAITQAVSNLAGRAERLAAQAQAQSDALGKLHAALGVDAGADLSVLVDAAVTAMRMLDEQPDVGSGDVAHALYHARSALTMLEAGRAAIRNVTHGASAAGDVTAGCVESLCAGPLGVAAIELHEVVDALCGGSG